MSFLIKCDVWQSINVCKWGLIRDYKNIMIILRVENLCKKHIYNDVGIFNLLARKRTLIGNWFFIKYFTTFSVPKSLNSSINYSEK